MRYILGVFAVLVLLILVIILIFRRTPVPTSSVQTGDKQVVLADYTDKPATMEYTMRGAVTAEENRRAIRITVSEQERVIEILSGYNENVERRERFSNNQNAYSNFLIALDKAGFSREQETDIEDERGTCPLGKRFIYKFEEGNDRLFRLWSTSCLGKQGSFGGNESLVRRLFQNQIPDYTTLVRGVRL